MADFLGLWKRKHEVTEEYFSLWRETEESRDSEYKAVVKMEAFWRGEQQRMRLREMTKACIDVQRTYRGHIGRAHFRTVRRGERRKQRAQYCSDCATSIQSVWRGYYSRQNVHDFHMRKKYLENIRNQNESLSKEMTQTVAKQEQEQETRRQAKEAARQKKRAEKSHHLLGTATVEGPYSKGGPTGLDDASLKQATKSIAAKQKKKPKQYYDYDAKAMGQSLRASRPFDAEADAVRALQDEDRARRLNPKGFVSSGHMEGLPESPFLHTPITP